MSSALDIKRVEVELMRVSSARFELELKVMERLEDIERLKDHIRVQLEKEAELNKKIEGLKTEPTAG